MKHILTLCTLLLLSGTAYAVQITINTTPRQDSGALFACTSSTNPVDAQNKPRDCTVAEVRTYIEARFNDVLDSYADTRERVESRTQGIAQSPLVAVAQDRDIPLSVKCAMMNAKGHRERFERAFNVTCP